MFRRFSLSTVLILFTLVVTALAITLVGLVGGTLLGRLADQQALARIHLAGQGAQQAIERSLERRKTAARLLAERPTLQRLVSERQIGALGQYIEDYGRASELSACALIFEGEVLARSGIDLPWLKIWSAHLEGEGPIVHRVEEFEYLLVDAWAPVSGSPGVIVGVALILDEAYAEWTSEKVGMQISIIGVEKVQAVAGPRALLRARALHGGEAVSDLIAAEGLYASTRPLRDPNGMIVGVIEATLSRTEVEASLRELGKKMLLLTVAIGSLAVLATLLLSRWIVGPLAALTDAAARIARGDFASPVPGASGAEVGLLARTMENMRGQILSLTVQLQRKRDEAEAILVGIVEGVFAVDRERRIRYLNPQAEQILGITASDALGRFCGDVLNPLGKGGRRPCEESCPILHARFRGSARATEKLLLPTAEQRSVVITSAPPSGRTAEDHHDSEQYQVIRDETEVEATRRLRDSVLANISHEFRSPLSAQLASLELLRDRLPELTREELQALVLSLERGALRLTRLIDNLLESIRIEAGEVSLRRQPVMLDAVVEEAVELMAPLIDQRDQELEVSLPYPLPPLAGDATRLVQVLVNLLANANKFAPARSTITVGGSIENSEVRLWVQDEGPGLPPATEGALFERFTRSPGEEPEESGMGLGLWIVKSIVDRHGGRVETQSGQSGTRIYVVLPIGERQ